MVVVRLLIQLGFIALALYFAFRLFHALAGVSRGYAMGAVPPALHGVSRRLWNEVVKKCGHDAERALRMVEHEKTRAPGLSDDEACKMAVWRIEQDNR